jgi:hypothetical protein
MDVGKMIGGHLLDTTFLLCLLFDRLQVQQQVGDRVRQLELEGSAS